ANPGFFGLTVPFAAVVVVVALATAAMDPPTKPGPPLSPKKSNPAPAEALKAISWLLGVLPPGPRVDSDRIPDVDKSRPLCGCPVEFAFCPIPSNVAVLPASADGVELVRPSVGIPMARWVS